MSHPFTSWILIPDETTIATAGTSSYTPGRDFLLDADGDIDLSSGDIQFTRGLAAVAQDLYVAIKMFKGEWFLNREVGIPYLPNDIVSETDALLGQKFSALKARAAFRTAIMSVQGVEKITKLAVSFETSTRAMSVVFTVKTVAGTIVATEEFN